MRNCLIILYCLCFFWSSGQTLGGGSAYGFLKLPSSTLLAASGGVNLSYLANDAGLAANNPATLMPGLHSQVSASFNGFLGDIKLYSATAAFYNQKLGASFSGHVFFVDYGTLTQTDASGNILGSFRAADYVVQAGASKQYLTKWHYGINLKFIRAQYASYASSAFAADAGLLFADSAAGFFASVLARNMGVQITNFVNEKEDLPFDLQIGFTKKLLKAPLAFSVSAQQAHRFNIFYDNENVNAGVPAGNASFFNKLMLHFVVATHLYIGNHLEAIAGYNHLRRSELNTTGAGNGLNGFSAGVRLRFDKLQVQFARACYQQAASNQLGITVSLNRIFGASEL